jgi:hypothetical protein
VLWVDGGLRGMKSSSHRLVCDLCGRLGNGEMRRKRSSPGRRGIKPALLFGKAIDQSIEK